MSRDGLIKVRGMPATIENLAEAQNSSGEVIPGTAVAFAEGFALIQPLSGHELITAQQLFAEVTHRISWTPFVAGVKAKMRVSAGGVVYEILAPLNIETRNRELELLAVERGV